jgi:predicted nuclease of restriction endonuclease-like (RecB) superfamily
MSENQIDKNYIETLVELKEKIKTAQIKAALSVNSEMICLYWEIGKTILEQQEKQGWGANIINQLSKDLQKSFPEMKGFSSRNLSYMKKLAEIYPDFTFLQQVVAKLPWGQNIVLLDKISTKEERIWYIQKTIKNGWSRNVLVHQIESQLYERQAFQDNKTTNFLTVLPSPASDLAQDMLKDPYKFDFLGIGEESQEREIENALVWHMKKFLLELGAGFAFVGQQYHLEVGGEDFYLDLLFYHLKLRCYVVIELKSQEFKPEYAGKLNFYLSAVDDLLRHPDDTPSIGILLCKTKNKTIAEYALRDMSKPIGISEYKLTSAIPDELKASLPSIEELEKELKKDNVYE